MYLFTLLIEVRLWLDQSVRHEKGRHYVIALNKYLAQ